MKKKIIASIGTIAALSTPIIAVVSCGASNNSDSTTDQSGAKLVQKVQTPESLLKTSAEVLSGELISRLDKVEMLPSQFLSENNIDGKNLIELLLTDKNHNVLLAYSKRVLVENQINITNVITKPNDSLGQIDVSFTLEKDDLKEQVNLTLKNYLSTSEQKSSAEILERTVNALVQQVSGQTPESLLKTSAEVLSGELISRLDKVEMLPSQFLSENNIDGKNLIELLLTDKNHNVLLAFSKRVLVENQINITNVITKPNDSLGQIDVSFTLEKDDLKEQVNLTLKNYLSTSEQKSYAEILERTASALVQQASAIENKIEMLPSEFISHNKIDESNLFDFIIDEESDIINENSIHVLQPDGVTVSNVVTSPRDELGEMNVSFTLEKGGVQKQVNLTLTNYYSTAEQRRAIQKRYDLLLLEQASLVLGSENLLSTLKRVEMTPSEFLASKNVDQNNFVQTLLVDENNTVLNDYFTMVLQPQKISISNFIVEPNDPLGQIQLSFNLEKGDAKLKINITLTNYLKSA